MTGRGITHALSLFLLLIFRMILCLKKMLEGFSEADVGSEIDAPAISAVIGQAQGCGDATAELEATLGNVSITSIGKGESIEMIYCAFYRVLCKERRENFVLVVIQSEVYAQSEFQFAPLFPKEIIDLQGYAVGCGIACSEKSAGFRKTETHACAKSPRGIGAKPHIVAPTAQEVRSEEFEIDAPRGDLL